MKALYIFPLVTTSLGTWQIIRFSRKQKQEDSLPNLVSFSGSFLPTSKFLVGPRSYPIPNTKASVGYFVIQPFILKRDGSKILVNRGWMEKDRIASITNPVDIEITGSLGRSEKVCLFPCFDCTQQNAFMPNNQPPDWIFIDVDEMARLADTQNILLEITKPDASGFVPRSRTIVHHHLEYAITWFGMSFFSLYFLKRKGINSKAFWQR